MTEYTYKATDSSGTEQNGTINAHSLQAAREDLAARGLEPIEIYETPGTAAQSEPAPLPPPPPVAFVEHAAEQEAPLTKEGAPAYFPLYETLRLYAGWLLAWYCLVYAIGSYQFLKELPIHIPYAESLFLSPLVLSFTFGAYLFLLLSGIFKMTGKRKPVAVILLLVGIAAFLLYRMNV